MVSVADPYGRIRGFLDWNQVTITTTIPEIIQRLVFYLKHGVSETAFCLL
jgi:hypothetical protein